jgi:hypothetical protein
MSDRKEIKKTFTSQAKTYADSSQKKTVTKKTNQESLRSNRKNLMV